MIIETIKKKWRASLLLVGSIAFVVAIVIVALRMKAPPAPTAPLQAASSWPPARSRSRRAIGASPR